MALLRVTKKDSEGKLSLNWSLKNDNENSLRWQGREWESRQGEQYVQRPGGLIKLALLKEFIIVTNCCWIKHARLESSSMCNWRINQGPVYGRNQRSWWKAWLYSVEIQSSWKVTSGSVIAVDSPIGNELKDVCSGQLVLKVEEEEIMKLWQKQWKKDKENNDRMIEKDSRKK